MATYDRYVNFRRNGSFTKIPNVKLSVKSTDYYDVYRKGITRLDRLSYDYYGDPNYDWLIMMANPEFGSMEFSIRDGALLRIPFPLDETIRDYTTQLERYNSLYGLD